MLIEVMCDRFVSNGKRRPPIRFHAGLNAILGDDKGSNSIGKSTFLMILDFVFGGSDYIKKCVDVQKNVLEHTICFAFNFDGETFYFSRNTVDYKNVIRCDAEYHALPDEKPIPIKNYQNFLYEKYGLTEDGLSWRGAVSRFIRVYKRDTLDEERPIRSAKDEKTSTAIEVYMRLFNRYSVVDAQIKQAALAEDEKESLRKSIQQYNHIRAAKNEKEKKANESRIAELEEQARNLSENNNQGLLDLDSITAKRLSDLNESLIQYRRQQAQIQTQLKSVRRDMTGPKRSFKRMFTELERFFPHEDFKALEEVEGFHQKLNKILEDEFTETEKNLTSAYSLVNNEILEIEKQIAEIKNIPNVSQAILYEYARITTELNNLRQANQNYDELERLKQVAADYAATRDSVIADELHEIENSVNQKMRDITREVLAGDTRNPPVLELQGLKKYTFHTPDDGGTGAQYRGLIIFDLANMALASVPFLVHDSLLFKNIEKPTFGNIIEFYQKHASHEKQVFISYDSLGDYDKKTRDLMEENAVLRLSPGGNELFGWAWNKEKKNESAQI